MYLVGIRGLRCLFKSIVALRAASEISRILGNNDKSQQYNVRVLPPFIIEANLIHISAAVYRHLVPGTVADDRARIGPNSLHAFLRKQHIVSVVFAVTDDSEVAISWGLLYNLYADRLLNFNMFPLSVYETREFSSAMGARRLCYLSSNHSMNRNQVVRTQTFQLRNPIGQ